MRAALALAVLIGTTLTAVADSGPTIVIPGRPGVPIVINGVDVSYAVLEGDWGLAKNVHVQPTVYGGHYIDPGPPVGHYFPSNGRLPGYGRLEIEPPAGRHFPRTSQSYHQSWSAQSTPQPAQSEVPFYPPGVINAPQESAFGSPQGALGSPQEFSGPPRDFRHRKSRRFPH
jgi:hypothetical protein